MDTYVGAVPFDFSVDANGSAVLQIPIEIPPGTAGAQPHLSIVHSSGGGNDLLGVGTSLHGLSAITRTAATRAQDGFTGVVGYGPDDRWSLDGQRLMLATGNSYDDPQAVYHTELESWNGLVPAIGATVPGRSGPDSFTVFSPDGSRLEYGTTADSALPPSPGSPHVRQWALATRTDPFGNVVAYTYSQDVANSCLYLVQVSYSQSATQQAQRAVTFDYEARPAGPDTAMHYRSGYPIAMLQRLRGVTTLIDEAPVLRYTFAYETSIATGRSRLTHVTKADEAGATLPPTVLGWQDGGIPGLADTETLPSTGVDWSTEAQLVPLDANGDGHVDVVHAYPSVADDGLEYLGLDLILARADGTGYDAPASVPDTGLLWGGQLLPMDVDGDGCCDLVYACPAADGMTMALTVLRSTLGDDGSCTLTRLEVGGAGPAGLFWPASLVAMDVDGDGRVDLVYSYAVNDPDDAAVHVGLLVLLSDGTRFTPTTPDLQSTTCPYSPSTSLLVPLDMDGDGRSDLLLAASDPEGHLVGTLFLSDGSVLVEQDGDPLPEGPRPWLGAGSAVLVVDVNGDGLSDLLHVGPDPDGTLVLSTFVADGIGFQPADTVSTGLPFDESVPVTVVPFDVNGDGCTDLALLAPTDVAWAVTLAVSTGAGYTVQASGPVTVPTGSTLLPLDLAGSGKTGLVSLAPGLVDGRVVLGLASTPAAGPYPDLITSIDNGIGGTWRITHRPMTDPTVYTRLDPSTDALDAASQFSNRVSGATFPLTGTSPAASTPAAAPATRLVDFPRYVVSSHDHSDGRGATDTWTHLYAAATLDLTGRGWQGFADRSVTDADLGATTRSICYTDFPLTAAPGEVSTSAVADSEAHQVTTYTYTTTSTVPGVWLVRPATRTTQFLTEGRLDFSHLTSWIAYDDFGNPTALTDSVDGVPGAPLTTTSLYDNDTTSWRLGRITRRTRSADAAGAEVLDDEQWGYDPDTGALSWHETWDDQHQRWLHWSYGYDQYGNRTRTTDPDGAQTSTTFDPTYNTFRHIVTGPPDATGSGLTWSYTHDARFGVETVRTDPNGTSIDTTYDDLGRPLGVTTTGPGRTSVPVGTWRWSADADGPFHEESRRTDWTEETWSWQRHHVDGLARAWKTTALGPDGSSTVTTMRTFTSRDQIRTQTQACLDGDVPVTTTWVYDPANRTASVVRDPADATSPPQTTTFTYPTTQRTVRVEAAGSAHPRTTILDHGLFAGSLRVVAVTDAAGATTTADYDGLGRITTVADPAATHTMTYDSSSRRLDLVVTGSEEQLRERLVHDDLARTVTQTDATGDAIVLTFDALGRVLTKQVTGVGTSTFTYDAPDQPACLGRVSSVVLPDGTTHAYGYDTQGNQTVVTLLAQGEAAATERSVWNPDGTVAEVTAPDFSVVSSTYTESGTLRTVVATTPEGVSASVTYGAWTALGAATTATYGNGTQESWAFDGWHRPTRHQLVDATGVTLLDQTVTWNDLDQVDGVLDGRDPDATESFTYDPVGRLSTAAGPYPAEQYTYDGAGGLLGVGDVLWASDGYRLTTASRDGADVGSATYDAAGNLTTLTIDDSSSGYTFDAERRLTGADGTAFGYDHDGRRLWKRPPAPAAPTLYVTPRFDVVPAPEGPPLRTVYATGAAGPFATLTVGPTAVDAGTPQQVVQYHHRNHVNSTLLTTTADGRLGSRLRYLPYGRLLDEPEADILDGTFTGQELDPETGLTYMQSRYYHAGLGRFLTADDRLAGDWTRPDAFHRYAYGLGDPLAHYDPTGHFSLSSVWSHAEHWLAKDWHWVASFAIDTELVAYGVTLMVLSPIEGPAGTILASTLLGAGISGFAYDIQQLVTHKTFSWKDYAIQLGIGAGAGLVSGGFAAGGTALVDSGASAARAAFYAGGFARLAVNTAAATLGSTTSAVGGQLLNNLAGGYRLGHALGWSALLGAGTGFAGGMLSELVAGQVAYTNRLSDQRATEFIAQINADRGLGLQMPRTPATAGVTWASPAGTLLMTLPGASFSGIDALLSPIRSGRRWL